MKIRYLLSVLVCGIASQFMVGCASSGQYFDFSVPSTAHQKVAPKAPISTVAPAETPAQNAPESTSLPLEASAAKPTTSAKVVRTAPLTTSAVAITIPANAVNDVDNSSSKSVTTTSSRKDIKTFAKKLKRDVKAAKNANALNQYVKLGILLIVIGLVLALFNGLIAAIGGIVAVVGVIVLVLGILEML